MELASSTHVTMWSTERGHFLFSLLLLVTATFCFLSYLFGGESYMKTFGAYTISSRRYLSMLRRCKYRKLVAEFESKGYVSDQNRTIVFRYRSNTSTLLKPTPGAGRLSAIFLGRTGNRMRIYAALYGIARRNGMRHVVSANNPLLKLFDLKAAVIPVERPGRDWVKYVPEYKGSTTDVAIIAVHIRRTDMLSKE